jgi:hypothetical protein
VCIAKQSQLCEISTASGERIGSGWHGTGDSGIFYRITSTVLVSQANVAGTLQAEPRPLATAAVLAIFAFLAML